MRKLLSIIVDGCGKVFGALCRVLAFILIWVFFEEDMRAIKREREKNKENES